MDTGYLAGNLSAFTRDPQGRPHRATEDAYYRRHDPRRLDTHLFRIASAIIMVGVSLSALGNWL